MLTILLLPIVFGLQQVSPDTTAQLEANATPMSNFKLRLHAPAEDKDEAIFAIQAVDTLNQAEQAADTDETEAIYKRLLQNHKNNIRDVIQGALLPIIASVPDPVRAEVLAMK